MSQVPEGYYAVLFRDSQSGVIGVRFPDHPNIVTYGKTWDEARKMAEEALSATMEVAFETELPLGRKINKKRGERVEFIRLSPKIRIAYLLRSCRTAAGFNQKQMAHKLGMAYQSYQRMERPGRANLTVITLDKIAKALHGELVLDLRLPSQKKMAA